MRIDIQTKNFSMTDALHSHAERRMRFALTRGDDHIRRMVMRLSVINGPRGGAVMRCHLQVMMARLPDVLVEDIQADVYLAIDRATDRAGRTVVRKIDHHQGLLKEDHAFESKVPQTVAAPALLVPVPDSDATGDVADLITDKNQNPN